MLQRVFPGVFAFGTAELTQRARWWAALLACGEGAALSHVSAALFWGLLRIREDRPHVTVRGARGREVRGIAAHRCRLRDADVVDIAGMRVTTPMRTLIDLAEVVSPALLAEAFDQAMLRGRFDGAALPRLLADAHGRRCLHPLRRVLAEIGAEPEDIRSRRERAARDLLVANGVRRPVMNGAIALGDGRYRYADLWFAEERVDIEIDGPRHRLPHRRRQDAVRDSELAGVGVLVDRYPDTILDADPSGFVRGVAALLEQRRTRRGGVATGVRAVGCQTP